MINKLKALLLEPQIPNGKTAKRQQVMVVIAMILLAVMVMAL